MRSEDIAAAHFGAVTFQEGYDMIEVDRYLDDLVRNLREREGGREPGDASILTAAAVSSMRFSRTRFRDGYLQADVDELLARVAESFAGDAAAIPSQRPDGPITSRQVESVRFRCVTRAPGYSMDEVDALLERVAAELRRREIGESADGEDGLTAESVREAGFTGTTFTEGYAPDDVDAFLEAVAEAFETAHA